MVTDSPNTTRASFQNGVPSTYAVHVCGWLPVIVHADRSVEVFRRKVRSSPHEAIEYCRRTLFYRHLRANIAKRKLAAISDPWWVEMVASMGKRRKLFHAPVNVEKTAFQGWL